MHCALCIVHCTLWLDVMPLPHTHIHMHTRTRTCTRTLCLTHGRLCLLLDLFKRMSLSTVFQSRSEKRCGAQTNACQIGTCFGSTCVCVCVRVCVCVCVCVGTFLWMLPNTRTHTFFSFDPGGLRWPFNSPSRRSFHRYNRTNEPTIKLVRMFEELVDTAKALYLETTWSTLLVCCHKREVVGEREIEVEKEHPPTHPHTPQMFCSFVHCTARTGCADG